MALHTGMTYYNHTARKGQIRISIPELFHRIRVYLAERRLASARHLVENREEAFVEVYDNYIACGAEDETPLVEAAAESYHQAQDRLSQAEQALIEETEAANEPLSPGITAKHTA